MKIIIEKVVGNFGFWLYNENFIVFTVNILRAISIPAQPQR